ncbi:MAG: hypothetical protein ACK5JL_02780 [Candidatus Kapaibacterium sp.]
MALEELMPSIRAKKRIDAGNYDATDYQAVYQLWLEAYGDEQIAANARNQAVQLLVDKHCGKMP